MRLEDGGDGFVDADEGGGDAVDGVGVAIAFGEVEETADVVVLVAGGEEALGFAGGESEGGKSHGLVKFAGEGEVAVDEFAKGGQWIGRPQRPPAAECTAGGERRKEARTESAEKKKKTSEIGEGKTREGFVAPGRFRYYRRASSQTEE